MKQSIIFLISILAFAFGCGICVTAWRPIIPALIVGLSGMAGMILATFDWEEAR